MFKAIFFVALGVVATVAFYEPETAQELIKDGYATSKTLVIEGRELLTDGGRLDR